MTGQEVVQRTPQQEILARVRSEEFKSQVALVLPADTTPEKFGRIFGTMLLNSPEVAEAEPNSIMQSLLRCAEMGLMPDGREAAIVTFFSKREQVKKAQAIPMIGGFRKSAADHGWTLRTQVVYANDEFEHVLVPEEDVRRHNPVRPGGARGALIAAYATATHKDGRRQVKVLYEEDIAKIQAVSRATGPGTPWQEWRPQMWAKSAGRALYKELPLADSDRAARILAAPIEPADAAAAIYGPGARAALQPGETVDRSTGEISPAAAPEDVGGRPAVSPDAPKAEGAASPLGGLDPSAPTAPSAPEDDYPVEDTSFSGQLPLEAQELKARVEEAGAAIVPSRRPELAGKTIAQVAAMGTVGSVSGEGYLRWCLDPTRGWDKENADPKRKEFLAAVRTYVGIMLPDLWAEAQKG